MSKHALLKGVALLYLTVMVAMFFPQVAAADDDDPPGRVARLSYTQGVVSFQPAGTDDWVSAVVNRPMTTGDKLWSDKDARAEMHLGSASIRAGSGTGFSFLNLTDNVTQVRITQGTVRIRVKHLEENEVFEVDTPNLAFSILRAGIYKVNVNEVGDTTVVEVRRGEGEMTGGGTSYSVHSGEVGTFYGLDQLSADVQRAAADQDDFERWCEERDRREERSISARYVSTDVIGYEDLDDYGGWRTVSEYGEVWFPHTTVVGWAPYHYGYWAYIVPWGYTWVDEEPWGFAPFHYGRWINVGGAWGWIPARPASVGVVYVRPVYAPALVAWVGGRHFGIGVSVGGGYGGNVGWFPLGPREVYVPSYRVSRTYINNVNVSNTTVNTTVINNYYTSTVVNRTNVTNHNFNEHDDRILNARYVNQGVPGAITATTPQAFTSAQPVSRNIVKVDDREVTAAPVSATAPQVTPSRVAIVGNAPPAAAKPPASMQTRQVVARVAPPPPAATFEKQEEVIRANGGRPPTLLEVRQAQTGNAAAVPPNVRMAAAPNAPQNVVSPGAHGTNGQDNPVDLEGRARMRSDRPVRAPMRADRPPSGGSDARQASYSGSGASTPINAVPPNSSVQPNSANQPASRNYTDRPVSVRPTHTNSVPEPSELNPQIDERQRQVEGRLQKEQEQLRQQQDQQRQRIEQQQQQERQRLQQSARDLGKEQQLQQQLEQRHNQQLQQLEQRHAQEQQHLQQQQVQQRMQQSRQAPAAQPERAQPAPQRQQTPPPQRQQSAPQSQPQAGNRGEREANRDTSDRKDK
ncbi:MAG: hypothetical protein NVS9B4_10950 [Candidatus Acidiferrum sp.]